MKENEIKEIKAKIALILTATVKASLSIRLKVSPPTVELLKLEKFIDNVTDLPEALKRNIKLSAYAFIEQTVLEEIDDDFKEAMRATGMEPEQFIANLDINAMDLVRVFDFTDSPLENRKTNSGDSYTPDYSEKFIGQKAMIEEAIFTNMLVTSDGVQVPYESLYTPFMPELAGLVATVTEVDSNKFTYLCGGCSQKHNANTRIAFEDYTMEFYISGDLLKSVEDEQQ